MDFFKSVFSGDDDQHNSSDQPTGPTTDPGSSAAWSFGGLVKTLADKSESVIEFYRKDLEELGSGLKKETEVIRGVASRAVNDSLEIGASVAQEKLESVGQAIDDIGSSVWKSTAQIISHGKNTILSPSDDDNSDSEIANNEKLNVSNNSTSEKRYSRFEVQVRALQSDISTYSMEPEDLEGFENWKLGFDLEQKEGEIEDLLNENSVVKDIFRDVVSDEVEFRRYWYNYFYKLGRLMNAEEARAKLVQRAISGEEEEDLSWDIEEDDEEEESGDVDGEKKKDSNEDGEKKKDSNEDGEKSSKNDDEKGGSCKDSDVSVVSSQLSMPEEEGWDEIEEIQTCDENKGEDVGTASKVDLHKRLSVAEEEEDLSWDIDDDEEDQPVKS